MGNEPILRPLKQLKIYLYNNLKDFHLFCKFFQIFKSLLKLLNLLLVHHITINQLIFKKNKLDNPGLMTNPTHICKNKIIN